MESGTRLSEPLESPTLIDQLLAEQRLLTPVATFSRQHEKHGMPQQARYYRDLIPFTLPKKGQQYAFEVELDKCSGCKACVTACHSLNGLEETETWRSVGLLHGGTAVEPLQINVTTACHHCIEPACLNGCPVLAYEKDSVTGIVHHLDDQCIGCQYCVLKCPYEVPQYRKKKGIVRKCDMCSSRLLVNEAPACVQACPNEAIRITLVDKQQITLTTLPGDQLVPGAPTSDYTIPTTRYRTQRKLPSNIQSADFSQMKPAPSHLPLSFMLVLTQLSVGLFCIDLLYTFFGTTAYGLKSIHALTALLFGFLGIGVSILHLGRPLQAWRAFLGFRQSWLSREVISFGLFMTLAAFHTASLWFPASFPIRPPFQTLLNIAVTVSGLLGVFCSVMVYVDTRRSFWNFRLSAGKFFGSTILLGLGASAGLEAVLNGDASNWLLAGFVSSAAIKLMWEANFFFSERDKQLSQLKQSASLQLGVLHKKTIARFGCGLLGGIILPGALLLFSQLLNPQFIGVLALVSFMLCLLGELLERYLYFTAVAPPKMPGGVSP